MNTADLTAKSKSGKYSMNLSEEMVNNIIAKSQDDIVRFKESQNAIDGELQEAKQMYDEVKQKFDEFQARIDLENKILNAMVHYKNVDSNNKTIKVYTSLDNTKVKSKKTNRQAYHPWQETIKSYLINSQQFLKVESLVRQILIDNPTWTFESEKALQSYIKHVIIYRIKNKKMKDLVLIGESVGFNYWLEDDGKTVKVKYLKLGMANINH